MGTKVKGLIRGIKNISSQIFEDEKEQEFQIGQPTDVKHVAHIGGDGPAVESPSWMKGFDGKDSQSGPLDKTGGKVETPEVKWVSEGSCNI
ncbi:putative CRIB domain-containing protein RIC1 [Helianthus annuus]|nr:putative CRIB domain-containing protein RIC1 [Helianthus annuus]